MNVKLRSIATTFIELVGCLAILGGISQISTELALIVSGILMVAAGYALSREPR